MVKNQEKNFTVIAHEVKVLESVQAVYCCALAC